MNLASFFSFLHRSGLAPFLVRHYPAVRKIILENVHYNTEWIMNQTSALDMLTDSLMQRPMPDGKKMGLGFMEASSLELSATFKRIFGYDHVIPLAQGRLGEMLFARVFAKPGTICINNGLFTTTRYHMEMNDVRLVEIPVADAAVPESDFPFKGNLDLEKFKLALRQHQITPISFVLLETCANAYGGHPISMENLKSVYSLAKEYHVPLYLDACRIFENAVLIREREPGYGERSIPDLVREMCSYSDGATLSATKDFPVDTGAFIGINREDWFLKLQEAAFLFGDGLSVRSKAMLNEALKTSFKPAYITERVEQSKKLWYKLKTAGVPLVHPYTGFGVFIDTRELFTIFSEKHYPQKAFLAELFAQSGILACENMLTKIQQEARLAMVRLAIPCTGISKQQLDYCAKHVTLLWRRRATLPLLKKISVSNSKAEEFLAHYAILNPDDPQV